MGRHCPHLGLQGDRHQLFLLPNARHRCYLSGRPERVAEAHQGEICLTSAYWRCLRLASPPPGAQGPLPEGTAERPLPVRYPNLRPLGRRAGARRPLTLVELLVAGLSASILLAGCLVAYGLVHRLQVGPGMQAVAAGVTAPLPTSLTAVETEPPMAPASPADSATTLPGTAPSVTAAPAVLPTASPAGPEPALLPPASPAPGAPPTPLPEPTLPFAGTGTNPPAQSPPTRLTIARIGLDIPVLSVSTRIIQKGDQSRAVWGDVPNAGGFHNTSAYPGNAGNIVINGHRDIQGSVFRTLDRVEVGDEIVLYVGDVPYTYRVTETLVVPETFASAAQQAENLRLIGPFPEERLTLVTCTPIALATHRLLVIARPAD